MELPTSLMNTRKMIPSQNPQNPHKTHKNKNPRQLPCRLLDTNKNSNPENPKQKSTTTLSRSQGNRENHQAITDCFPLSVLSSWCNKMTKWAPSLKFIELHVWNKMEQLRQRKQLLDHATNLTTRPFSTFSNAPDHYSLAKLPCK